jgi:LysR family transcriptional regulator, benzoate and cis,cis-muconate-responsive activator of ben and cat genes
MELRHLRYFVAVAEAENVSRAALQLHVSQPGVSRQIHDLEDEIGFLLFERSAKAVRLTPAGKVLLTEARAVLAHVETAVQKARAAANSAGGEIHVGYAPSLTVRILPPTLRQFQQALPAVRVKLHDLSTEEMLGQLRAGKLAVALLVQPPRAALRGLKFQELARYPMCAAVSPAHPLAKAKSLTLAKISGEPLIGYSREDYPEYHTDLDRLFAREKKRPVIAEEHDGVTSLVAAVEAGRGLALVPDCLACMVGPRLKLIPLAGVKCDVVVGAAWRPGKIPAAAEKFLAVVTAL